MLLAGRIYASRHLYMLVSVQSGLVLVPRRRSHLTRSSSYEPVSVFGLALAAYDSALDSQSDLPRALEMSVSASNPRWRLQKLTYELPHRFSRPHFDADI